MSRFLILAACLLLSGCADGLGTTPTGFSTSSRTLMSYNYNAVDSLLWRAGRAINKNTPMLVSTVANVNNVNTSSTLGRTISEQLSAHLAEEGYKVSEMKLRQGITIQEGGLTDASAGEYLLSRDVRNVAAEHKAAVAVTGTYSVAADHVLVNLHLIDIRTGNLITGYDYVLPKTEDVATMTRNSSTGPDSFFTTSNGF